MFETVAPCAEPVQTGELLTEIEATIRRHVILNEQAAAALAVWVLHTYTFELRDAVAYVAIESPEKRCGKTTLVSVLAAMAHTPLIAANITLSALFRGIDRCRPTLFIDEADTFLAGNGSMRGIINSGNTWRTAYVLRLSRSRANRGERKACHTGVLPHLAEEPETEFVPPHSTVPGGAGGESGLIRYSCWCPKVIALIGETPDTIADRSIVVKMSRKLVSESCAPLSDLDPAGIKAKCARFALDAREAIAHCGKIRGEGLNDRAADTFDPLYAIARLAGGDWEKKLHAAALALTATAQHENAGVELLLDILSILIESGQKKIFSRDLVATLRSGDDGLRSLALKDSEVDEYSIAKRLRPYGIKPVVIRIGKEVNRGYVDTDFREALHRYVPRGQIEARAEELRHRGRLQKEASELAKKEAAEREKARAEEREKEAEAQLPEALAMLARLRRGRGGKQAGPGTGPQDVTGM